jgi:hypothetical protein
MRPDSNSSVLETSSTLLPFPDSSTSRVETSLYIVSIKHNHNHNHNHTKRTLISSRHHLTNIQSILQSNLEQFCVNRHCECYVLCFTLLRILAPAHANAHAHIPPVLFVDSQNNMPTESSTDLFVTGTTIMSGRILAELVSR